MGVPVTRTSLGTKASEAVAEIKSQEKEEAQELEESVDREIKQLEEEKDIETKIDEGVAAPYNSCRKITKHDNRLLL